MDKSKLDSLLEKEKQLKDLIDLNNSKLTEFDREISHKRKLSDEIQEKLIREGNAITVEELKVFKEDRDKLKVQSVEIKSKLHKLMDLVPLVLAGKKLVELKEQLDRERREQSTIIAPDKIREELNEFAKKVQAKIDLIELNKENRKKIEEALKSALKENQHLSKKKKESSTTLLGYSQEQYLNFQAVFDNINGPFVTQLNAIVQEEKNNRVLLSNVLKQIKHAEARKDNELAKKYREEKASINNDIARLTALKDSLLEETGALKLRLLILDKDLHKYEKDFKLEETDYKKYLVTEELLNKINKLIARIKEEKKYSLQNSLKLGLTKLMHKNGLVTNVRVNIADDIMDIDLISSNGTVINKDTLSKGEQQLYATALLKALVDESGIEFPVFIDSPLQKFDKLHSRNIFQEFYPTISQQVVLLPLLEKELTMEEFQLLHPNLSKTYVIQNENDSSKIITSDLMKIFNTSDQHVYTN
jgi:DNA sulfur modification protein DndD